MNPINFQSNQFNTFSALRAAVLPSDYYIMKGENVVHGVTRGDRAGSSACNVISDLSSLDKVDFYPYEGKISCLDDPCLFVLITEYSNEQDSSKHVKSQCFYSREEALGYSFNIRKYEYTEENRVWRVTASFLITHVMGNRSLSQENGWETI